MMMQQQPPPPQRPRAALDAAGFGNDVNNQYDLGDRFLRQARRGRLTFGDDGRVDMTNGAGQNAALQDPRASEMLREVQESRRPGPADMSRMPPDRLGGLRGLMDRGLGRGGDAIGGTPYGDDSRALEAPTAESRPMPQRPMGAQPIDGRYPMQRTMRGMGRAMGRGMSRGMGRGR